jgi:hypothetical protein
MLTIYETPTFIAEAAKIWSTEERLEFFSWIAGEPEAGVVIPGSGGCRKAPLVPTWHGKARRGSCHQLHAARGR